MPPDRRWKFLDEEPLPPAYQHRLSDVHDLVLRVLYNRGLTDPDDARGFLEGRHYISDPSQMLGMREAVSRILEAIRSSEPIVVYGDFDADGVTSTALLVQTLRVLGARVEPYIPHRVDEGYGLNCAALDRIFDQGTRLVITVDCGIRSPVEVAHANDIGLDVIVTDHHDVRKNDQGEDALPRALAVINPKRQGDPYRFKGLAGVGIAYKLAMTLLREAVSGSVVPGPVMLDGSDLLDLVALGTVADVMPLPLMDENRALVKAGLEELNRAKRPGIQAMLEEAGLRPGGVDSAAIGFVLGPRINAAGRLRHAGMAYDLLLAADLDEALPLAAELGALNRERQRLTLELFGRARERIVALPEQPCLYMLADPGYPSGLVGLVASRLCEEFYRPVVLIEQGAEQSRGSARSIREFNITEALDACADLLVRHGGHALAAGLTVGNENLPALQRRLEEIATAKLSGMDLAPELVIDASTELAELDYALVENLAVLQPFGNGNPEPVFACLGVEIADARPVGREGQHLKLTLRDPRTRRRGAQPVWDAIAFRLGALSDGLPSLVDLAFTLEINEYSGQRRLQLNVKDIRPFDDDRAAGSHDRR